MFPGLSLIRLTWGISFFGVRWDQGPADLFISSKNQFLVSFFLLFSIPLFFTVIISCHLLGFRLVCSCFPFLGFIISSLSHVFELFLILYSHIIFNITNFFVHFFHTIHPDHTSSNSSQIHPPSLSLPHSQIHQVQFVFPVYSLEHGQTPSSQTLKDN